MDEKYLCSLWLVVDQTMICKWLVSWD